MENQKSIIIADVDETICESCHEITPQMAQVIEALINKGFTFAFISGTKQSYLEKMISQRLRAKHYLLPTTGMSCIEVEDGNIKKHYNHEMHEHEREEILEALEKLTKEFDIVPVTSKEDQIQDRKSQVTLSAIGRSAPLDEKSIYDPDGKKRESWVAHLKTMLGDKYDMTIAGTTSIDITRKGLDKGWGITEFAQFHDLDKEHILFFGDKTYPGGNDHAATKVVDAITVKNPDDTLERLKAILNSTH